jgi:hypothetical protein
MTCVEEMTCGIYGNTTELKPFDVFKFYNYQYGVPDALVLGLFLGILVAGIFLWTRSLNILVILGIYVVTVTSVFAAAENTIAVGYEGVMWIIALALTSIVVIAVLKILRE